MRWLKFLVGSSAKSLGYKMGWIYAYDLVVCRRDKKKYKGLGKRIMDGIY